MGNDVFGNNIDTIAGDGVYKAAPVQTPSNAASVVNTLATGLKLFSGVQKAQAQGKLNEAKLATMEAEDTIQAEISGRLATVQDNLARGVIDSNGANLAYSKISSSVSGMYPEHADFVAASMTRQTGKNPGASLMETAANREAKAAKLQQDQLDFAKTLNLTEFNKDGTTDVQGTINNVVNVNTAVENITQYKEEYIKATNDKNTSAANNARSKMENSSMFVAGTLLQGKLREGTLNLSDIDAARNAVRQEAAGLFPDDLQLAAGAGIAMEKELQLPYYTKLATTDIERANKQMDNQIKHMKTSKELQIYALSENLLTLNVMESIAPTSVSTLITDNLPTLQNDVNTLISEAGSQIQSVANKGRSAYYSTPGQATAGLELFQANMKNGTPEQFADSIQHLGQSNLWATFSGPSQSIVTMSGPDREAQIANSEATLLPEMLTTQYRQNLADLKKTNPARYQETVETGADVVVASLFGSLKRVTDEGIDYAVWDEKTGKFSYKDAAMVEDFATKGVLSTLGTMFMQAKDGAGTQAAIDELNNKVDKYVPILGKELLSRRLGAAYSARLKLANKLPTKTRLDDTLTDIQDSNKEIANRAGVDVSPVTFPETDTTKTLTERQAAIKAELAKIEADIAKFKQ